jgi:3-oxoadipate enol-lactonase
MDIALPGGRTIAIKLEGPRDAPCIMLAHGVALDLRLWDDLVASVVPEYRVLRYDSRGHGGSPTGEGGFTLSDLGDDAIAVMDAAGVAKVHFVGLSMGGMVGMGLALDHGERLASAAICNARGAATPEYRKSWDDRSALVRQGGIAAIADATVSRWFTPEFPARNPDAVRVTLDMVLATSDEGYCASAEALKGLDYGSRLQENRVPVLYLAGEKDAGAPPPIVRRLHEMTPHSRYVELPGTGHISVTESPMAFRSAIIEFVRGADAGKE